MARGAAVNLKESGTSYMRRMTSNAVTSAFPTVANTTTPPATVDASHFTVPVGQYSDLYLSFFGTGDENSAFDFRIVGWSKVANGLGNDQSVLPIWKPTTIFRGTATLSTSIGVAGSVQATTERDADTIVAGSPVLTTSLYTVFSPADNTPGYVALNVLDYEVIAVYFDITPGATGANAFIRWIQG
jgi:hypothetical protein